jgi:outer membrane protein TolC
MTIHPAPISVGSGTNFSLSRLNKFLVVCLCLWNTSRVAAAQEKEPPTPRHITMQEAVQSALKHNHLVRIAEYKTEEKQHAKDVARSAYFPVLRNDSAVLNVTDTQFIGIPAGSLGVIGSNLVPPRTLILNQGGNTFVTSGTSLTQPLTQLLKIRRANDIALAEMRATGENQRQTENAVALKVHQIYYKLLIQQIHRSATETRILAGQDLETERVQQVKYGSSLDQDLIESRVQLLQAKQELLTTDLQLSDLALQLNDAIGFPLATKLVLDTDVPPVDDACPREACVASALAAHTEILEAQQTVNKATAAVRLAKADYIPDLEAFARYSYQKNVPFLANNFGTFGFHVGYNLFDGGRKRNTLREHQAQLAQATENLARVTEEVELGIRTAYNKMERTREMVKISQELLTLRVESSRVSAQQLQRGVALKSQADAALAQEFDAKTLLLQAQLDFIQSRDELVKSMGQTPQ